MLLYLLKWDKVSIVLYTLSSKVVCGKGPGSRIEVPVRKKNWQSVLVKKKILVEEV